MTIDVSRCLKFKLEDNKLKVIITPASQLNIPPSQVRPLKRDEIIREIAIAGYRNYFLYDDIIEQISNDFLNANSKVEKIIGEERDAIITIDISEDKMKAYLKVTPAYGGKEVSEEMIYESLKKAGIIHGIKKEVIDQAVFNLYIPKTIVAEGTPPENGKDSTFEYLVKEREKGPKELEDGSIDFKDLGLFTSVEVGNPLMRRHPPTPGEVGKNVLGEEIPPIPGKVIGFGHSKGSIVAPDDDNLLIATLSGEPKPGPNYVKVNPVIEVDEVGVKTGNIDFAGTVYVTGNVNKGYTVKAGEDIKIMGVVEASDIIANADIYLQSGVVGNNKARIKARGSIYAKFIEGASVEAGENIFISDQLMHSKTIAFGSVIVGSANSKGQIVGGFTKATNLIKAKSLGSPASTTTVLEVGLDPYIQDRLTILRQELIMTKKELEETIKSIIYLSVKGTRKKLGQILVEKGIISQNELEEALRIQSNNKNNKRVGEILVELGYTNIERIEEALNDQIKENNDEKINELKNKREELFLKVNMLSEDEELFSKNMSRSISPKIIGLDKIYAGVKISIMEKVKLIEDDSQGGTYYLSEDEITLGPVMKSDYFYNKI